MTAQEGITCHIDANEPVEIVAPDQAHRWSETIAGFTAAVLCLGAAFDDQRISAEFLEESAVKTFLSLMSASAQMLLTP